MGRRIGRALTAAVLALTLAVPVLAREPEALVPVGRTVGLELDMDGIYVAGFDGEASPAEAAGLRVGDRILAADGLPLDRAESLAARMADSGGEAVIIDVERAGRSMSFSLRPALREGRWRLGLCLRDRLSGLGTVTFYDPETGLFGALGHGVNGGEALLEIRGGRASETAVTGVQRGQVGAPGALRGPTSGGVPVGRVEENTARGLFGRGNQAVLDGEALPLARREEVTTGPAEIWSNVAGTAVEPYAVEIEAVCFDADRCRDLRLRVTDPRLLEATGGIVQGMSGSPILQNGRLVGAVTHVLVQDPTRGYGILIGHMLEAAPAQAA